MTIASYVVECAWDGSTVYTGTGSTLSSRVLSMEWDRGRDKGSQYIGRSIAGSLTLRLDNRSGDYNSFNSASPLYGNILPGRKVRVRATAVGAEVVNYTLWTGFLERITPSIEVGGWQEVTLEAIGPLGRISGHEIATALAEVVLSGAALSSALNEAGWSTTELFRDLGLSTLQYWYANNDDALEAIRQIEETELGFIGEGKNGFITFEARNHRSLDGSGTSTDHLTSQATFGDSATALLRYTNLTQSDPWADIANVVRLKVLALSTGLTDITLFNKDRARSFNPLIEAGTTFSITAVYPNPSSTAGAIGVGNWITLATSLTEQSSGGDYAAHLVSYDAAALNAAGTNDTMTAALTVTLTKKVGYMDIALANGSAQDVYLTTLRCRGTPLNEVDIPSYFREDTVSQGIYGKHSWPGGKQWLAVDSVSPANIYSTRYAQFILGVFSKPIPVITMSISANTDSNHMTQAFTRDISDFITVNANTVRTQLGFTDEGCFIEREHHVVKNMTEHWVTWECSPRRFFNLEFIPGLSYYGQNTQLA